MSGPLVEPTDPTDEQVAALLARIGHVDITATMIEQATEHVDYLTSMAKSWIINGDQHHGAMLQCLCIAFGYQQTEIERLKVENANLRASRVAIAKDTLNQASDYWATREWWVQWKPAEIANWLRDRAAALGDAEPAKCKHGRSEEHWPDGDTEPYLCRPVGDTEPEAGEA